MLTEFTELRNILSQVKLHNNGLIDNEKLTDFTHQVNQRASSNKPLIMVYGVYSAGKSTLINALAGKELAEVGKLPTTSQVKSYNFGDIELLDTPGIDAPLEHEKISREQLEKVDGVIFVLNSRTSLEEEQTYEEIGKLLAANKQLLVVMNNSTNLDESSLKYQALLSKFRTNLYQYLANQDELLNRLDQVPHFLVNAKSGLKAKLENKINLLEHSQLPALEQAVTRLFTETGRVEIAQTLKQQLYTLLEEALLTAKQNNQTTSREVQQLEQLIKSLQTSKHHLLNKVLAFAARDKSSLKDSIFHSLQAGDEQRANSLLEQWQTSIAAYYQEVLEQESQQLSDFSLETAKLFLSSPTASLGSNPTASYQEDSSNEFLEHLQALLKANGLSGQVTEEVAKQGIFSVLRYGKQVFPSLFKGIGPITMGRTALKYAPLVGALVEVGHSLYNYYEAEKYQQGQIAAERQHQEHLRNEANRCVDNYLEDLEQIIQRQLENIFNPLISSLQAELASLSGNENHQAIAISKLEELQMRLAH